MNRIWILFLLVGLVLTACSQAPGAVDLTEAANAQFTETPVPATSTSIPTETMQPTATPTQTPTATPTVDYPVDGRGPTNFDQDVSPLTGLKVTDPAVLERRPIIIKVENLPREHRPQWGLSFADLVYEYYTEFGGTRFAAVFYGQDAEQVGPIRSGRFFDANLIEMYKSVFVYGSAYVDVRIRLFNSDFVSRLLLETSTSCPAICRTDPNGQNLLVANTSAMKDYLVTRSVDNTRQNLDGMYFKYQTPSGGSQGNQVYIRYSGAIYNRWDYDAATGAYLRFVDSVNDVDQKTAAYVQLTDRLNNQPISADNLVTICVPHQFYVKRDDAEVVDIIMDSVKVQSYVACDGLTYTGNSGPAYVARDGQLYKTIWKRAAKDQILTISLPDGTPFALKPGQTWFEVIGGSSEVHEDPDGIWRFVHHMAP